MSSKAVLELYTLEEILELNDITVEELLEYLVERKVIRLPEIRPLEFEE